MGAVTVEIERRPKRWLHRAGELSLARPVLLGVLNITPDSFFDGGLYLDPAAAVDRGVQLIDEGADAIDVGGESTRPGARPVDAEEEWRRVGPVVEALSDAGVPISIDTRKLEVARRALDAGASIVNDVSGLRADARLADLAAERRAGLVIMHMRGTPETMQADVAYEDVVVEVRDFLRGAVGIAIERGCRREQLAVDPGIGFGKSARGNLELIAGLPALTSIGVPVLVGPSRKSFIGEVLDVPVAERLEGTLAACVVALERGARIFRVHDVRAARRALDMAEAIRTAGDEPGE